MLLPSLIFVAFLAQSFCMDCGNQKANYATCSINSQSGLTGTVDFAQTAPLGCFGPHDPIEILVSLEGFKTDDSQTQHALIVKEYGDLASGCQATGPIFRAHDDPNPTGFLGNYEEGSSEVINIRNSIAKLRGKNSIIGRSLVILSGPYPSNAVPIGCCVIGVSDGSRFAGMPKQPLKADPHGVFDIKTAPVHDEPVRSAGFFATHDPFGGRAKTLPFAPQDEPRKPTHSGFGFDIHSLNNIGSHDFGHNTFDHGFGGGFAGGSKLKPSISNLDKPPTPTHFPGELHNSGSPLFGNDNSGVGIDKRFGFNIGDFTTLTDEEKSIPKEEDDHGENQGGSSSHYADQQQGSSHGYNNGDDSSGHQGSSQGYDGQSGGSQGYDGQSGGAQGHEGQSGGSQGYDGQSGGAQGHQGQSGGSQGYDGQSGGAQGHEGQSGGSQGYAGQSDGSQGYSSQSVGNDGSHQGHEDQTGSTSNQGSGHGYDDQSAGSDGSTQGYAGQSEASHGSNQGYNDRPEGSHGSGQGYNPQQGGYDDQSDQGSAASGSNDNGHQYAAADHEPSYSHDGTTGQHDAGYARDQNDIPHAGNAQGSNTDTLHDGTSHVGTSHDGIPHDGIPHDGIPHDDIPHDGTTHDGTPQAAGYAGQDSGQGYAPDNQGGYNQPYTPPVTNGDEPHSSPDQGNGYAEANPADAARYSQDNDVHDPHAYHSGPHDASHTIPHDVSHDIPHDSSHVIPHDPSHNVQGYGEPSSDPVKTAIAKAVVAGPKAVAKPAQPSLSLETFHFNPSALPVPVKPTLAPHHNPHIAVHDPQTSSVQGATDPYSHGTSYAANPAPAAPGYNAYNAPPPPHQYNQGYSSPPDSGSTSYTKPPTPP